MKKRFLSLLMTAIVATTTIMMGTTGVAFAEETADSTKMVVGSPIEASTLDPAFNADFGSYQVLNQICEPIMGVDQEGNVVDGLASCEQIDELTYVYTFKEGILFSDGTELTAEDAAFSLQHTMDPTTGGNLGHVFANVESVEATDTYEMTMKLKSPDTTWKNMMAGSYALVFSKAAYEAVGKDSFGTAEGGIIGSGAYKLESWTPGESTKLVKNENYHDVDSVEIEEVELLYFKDPSAMLMALKTGQIDQIVEPSPTMFADINEMENVSILSDEPKAGVFLAFNCEAGPFADANVRKAVASAIDCDALMIAQYGEGNCVTANSFYCPLTAINESYDYATIEKSATEVATYEYDLKQAQEYLAESEYPTGFDCNIMCWGDVPSYNQSVAIQAMLKPLNINVEVAQQTVDEAVAAGYGFATNEDGSRVYDMFVTTWSTTMNEPFEYYQPMLSETNRGLGGANFACYSTPEIEELLNAVKTDTDPVKRAEGLAAINEIVSEEVPYVVIGYMNGNMALNNRFTYEGFSSSWICNLRYADFKITK